MNVVLGGLVVTPALTHRTRVRIPTLAWNLNFKNNYILTLQLKITHHQAPQIIAHALAGSLKDNNWVSHTYRLLTPQ